MSRLIVVRDQQIRRIRTRWNNTADCRRRVAPAAAKAGQYLEILLRRRTNFSFAGNSARGADRRTRGYGRLFSRRNGSRVYAGVEVPGTRSAKVGRECRPRACGAKAKQDAKRQQTEANRKQRGKRGSRAGVHRVVRSWGHVDHGKNDAGWIPILARPMSPEARGAGIAAHRRITRLCINQIRRLRGLRGEDGFRVHGYSRHEGVQPHALGAGRKATDIVGYWSPRPIERRVVPQKRLKRIEPRQLAAESSHHLWQCQLDRQNPAPDAGAGSRSKTWRIAGCSLRGRVGGRPVFVGTFREARRRTQYG